MVPVCRGDQNDGSSKPTVSRNQRRSTDAMILFFVSICENVSEYEYGRSVF